MCLFTSKLLTYMSDNKIIPENSYVSWKPTKGGIDVSWSYRVYYKQNKERITGCIPSLGIYFSAKDMDTFRMKEEAMSHSYFDTFFLHAKKDGLKKIIVELSKRGFLAHTNSNFLIHRISKNDIQPTKFKAKVANIPPAYEGAESIDKTMKRELAFA